MFRRMRAAEGILGIPGRGVRPDDPERESNRHMMERLADLAEEINERLDCIEGATT